MFWLTFAIFVVTTIIYVTWASGEIQPWNDLSIPSKNILSVDVTLNHDEKKNPEKPV